MAAVDAEDDCQIIRTTLGSNCLSSCSSIWWRQSLIRGAVMVPAGGSGGVVGDTTSHNVVDNGPDRPGQEKGCAASPQRRLLDWSAFTVAAVIQLAPSDSCCRIS